mgnify:CR=1 FL=1
MNEPSSVAPENLKDILKETISNLSPAYFALVMATGIVSVAATVVGVAGAALLMLLGGRWLFDRMQDELAVVV